jgi:glutamine---fructose-6-phosphate transaminase (isomerizing)
MCGIVAYVGQAEALPRLLGGLERLEYRGYDSAGVALAGPGGLEVRKSVGGVAQLAELVRSDPPTGRAGISHTRWATHGVVNVENAHPHLDADGRLAIVHNGVVENHKELERGPLERCVCFRSKTDTEVLAVLIGEALRGKDRVGREELLEALRGVLKMVRGSYGLALVHADLPGFLLAARSGSPLVLGIGGDGHFVASDTAAISPWVGEAVYLEEGGIVATDGRTFVATGLDGAASGATGVVKVGGRDVAVDKGRYPHHMLKEIHEQPQVLREVMRGRLVHGEATARFTGLHLGSGQLRTFGRLLLTGCGTSYHAALAGEYVIESMARMPVECEYASELRYRNAPIDPSTAVFALSQSGETADTLAALSECRRHGLAGFGICNNVLGAIARESDGGIGLRAGPEIGVAATKSFTAQLAIFAMLGLAFGRLRDMGHADGRRVVAALEGLPALAAETLELNGQLAQLAGKYSSAGHFLFMGRLAAFPVALEGALKLKEISYIPASAHPSAELKHGVIALVQEGVPSIFLVPNDEVYEKNLGNIEEVKARGGAVIGIGVEGDEALAGLCDDVVLVPAAAAYLLPVLMTIPLQLFAYHVAVFRGCHVDKPRNLAKSVTVE